jgi:LPXTG-site transpeptidase (sortase) family protein
VGLDVENEADLCADSSNPTGNPAIAAASGAAEDQGRIITFDLGNVENTSGGALDVVIEYRVMALDIATNLNGTALNNRAAWNQEDGSVSADPVTVVEPLLQIEKTVNSPAALPGDTLTFFITVSHSADSRSDAFDVIITDVVEPLFTYVPNSLRSISGVSPTNLDQSGAPTLTASWLNNDAIPDGGSVTIAFDVILGSLLPGNSASNTASAEWSSFPGDREEPPPNAHNIYSTERWYDPPSSIDIYGGITASSVVAYNSEAALGDSLLPDSGFTPNVETKLPAPSAGQELEDLGSIWLEIPSLEVAETIVGVPRTADGWDVTYLGRDIGYLNGSAFPTLQGNTVLTAHVYTANGSPGPFIDLDRLRVGDTFILHAFGQAYTYRISNNVRILPDDLGVLGHLEGDWVTLLTCAGFNATTGEYDFRRAVQASLIRITPDN